MAENIGGIEYTVDINTSRLIQGERKATASMNNMASTATKAATAITAAFAGIALGALAEKIVKVQRQFDVLNAGLITATGSVENAAGAFEMLQKFAATTPYSIDQAVTAFTRLTNLGLDPSIKSLTAYGNTAAAMGKDLMQMVEAVADASTGEFERLKEFGIRASKEGDNVKLTFKGVTETVKFSSENIQKYLLNLSEVNFGGAMEQRAKTLDGAISNLSDSWDQLFLTISKSGVGDEIARGVRIATTTIGELERSIQAGSLTSYFDDALPYIKAMEIAGVTLASVYAGKVVSAMAASAGATVSATMANRAALAEAVRVTTAELAQAQAAYKVAAATAAMGGSSTAAASAQARLTAATASAATAQAAFATSATAAGVAARAFGTVLNAMGGWVGVAVTALTILAFNWDKVSGAAESAATISENAADRIRKALSGASAAPMRDLIDGMGKAQKDLAAIDAQLAKGTITEFVGPRDAERQRKLTKEEIASLTERREALRGAVVDYGKAQKDLKASQMAGLFPDKPPEPNKPSGSGGTATAKTKGEKFDSQGYINSLVTANADGLAKIDAQEKDALDNAKKLLEEKKISQQQYQQAVTLIAQAAEKDRQDLRDKDEKDLQDWLDRKLELEVEAEKELQDKIKAAQEVVDPMGALAAEYERKKELFNDYAEFLIERGIATEQAVQEGRMAIESEYDSQRQQLAEQMYSRQNAANAFLMDSINALASTTTSAIVGLIDGTMTAQDAMKSLASTILSQAVGALVEVGVQELKNAIINKTTTAAKVATQTAAIATVTGAEIAGTAASTAAATTSAATIATAAAPAAALTSVASFGSAAVIGLGALAATMAAAKAFGGGRQYGGAVNADSFYRVGESGPEMFTASNGQNYMIPGQNGKVVPNGDLGGKVSVVVNNYASGVDVSAKQNSNGDVEITVQRAVAEVASQISSNSGVVWSAMKSSTSVQSKL